MPREVQIEVLATTRADLDAEATAGNLIASEIYHITDEGGIAIGRTVSAYDDIGGLANFTEAYNTTYGVASLTPSSTDTNVGIALAVKGNGAITAQIPTGTAAGGNARGIKAVDLQTGTRSFATQVASGNYSVLLSGLRNTASGLFSTVLNGSVNTSSGFYSTVINGNTCSATGNYSLASGDDSDATATHAVALGRRAKAGHSGSWVITDDQNADHSSTQTNEMRLRFENGVFINGFEALTTDTGLPKVSDPVDLGTGTGTTAISTAQSGTPYYSRAALFSTRSLRLDAATVGSQVQLWTNGAGIHRFTQGTGQTILQGSTVTVKNLGAATALCVATGIWSVVGTV